MPRTRLQRASGSEGENEPSTEPLAKRAQLGPVERATLPAPAPSPQPQMLPQTPLLSGPSSPQVTLQPKTHPVLLFQLIQEQLREQHRQDEADREGENTRTRNRVGRNARRCFDVSRPWRPDFWRSKGTRLRPRNLSLDHLMIAVRPRELHADEAYHV